MDNKKYQEKLDAFRMCFIGMMTIIAISIITSISDASAAANETSVLSNHVNGSDNTAITGAGNSVDSFNTSINGGLNVAPEFNNTNIIGVSSTNRVDVSTDLSSSNLNANVNNNATDINLGNNQSQGIHDSGNASQSQSIHDSGNANQSQSANSNQSQSANNTGNAQQVNFNSPKQYRNTPSVALFVPPPTATCQSVIGGSGMMPGVGFSISGSYTNENCERLEVAKALTSINQLEGALEVICTGKHVENVSVCHGIRNRGAVMPVANNSTASASQPVMQQAKAAQPQYITVLGKQLEVKPVRTYY